jgi:hypothetical protein
MRRGGIPGNFAAGALQSPRFTIQHPAKSRIISGEEKPRTAAAGLPTNPSSYALMPKKTIALLSVLLLAACDARQEQLGLREAVLARLQEDPDLKDYKLDPAPIADCVLKLIVDAAPGIPGDPRRDGYFKAYARMLSVKNPKEADEAVAQYKDQFGSQQAAREAALRVTDHIMSCMGEAIEDRGE